MPPILIQTRLRYLKIPVFFQALLFARTRHEDSCRPINQVIPQNASFRGFHGLHQTGGFDPASVSKRI